MVRRRACGGGVTCTGERDTREERGTEGEEREGRKEKRGTRGGALELRQSPALVGGGAGFGCEGAMLGEVGDDKTRST